MQYLFMDLEKKKHSSLRAKMFTASLEGQD